MENRDPAIREIVGYLGSHAEAKMWVAAELASLESNGKLYDGGGWGGEDNGKFPRFIITPVEAIA